MATQLRDIVTLRRLFYVSLSAVCAVATVALVAALVEPLRPPEDLEELSEKVAYFDAHRDEIDIIVVGSSRVYRALDPAQVEHGIIEAGCPAMQVFNFGMSGMSAPLLAKLADYIETTAKRPYLVFFEPELPLGPEFDYRVTDRSQYTNQWSTVVSGALQLAARFDGTARSLVDTGILYIEYAASFLRTGLGVGRLRDAILPTAVATQRPPNAAAIWAQDGFYSLDQELSASSGTDQTQLARRHDEVISPDGRAGLLVRLSQSKAALGHAAAANALQRAYVDYILDRTSMSKVKPAFIFMPINEPASAGRAAAMTSYIEAKHADAMVIKAGLSEMPELYRPELWFDYGHLTAAGAEDVSRFIGAQMCDQFRAQ